MFFRNVGIHPRKYMVSQPQIPQSLVLRNVRFHRAVGRVLASEERLSSMELEKEGLLMKELKRF
jgi:hypothetical protein